jgi:hypothetical protein
MNQEFKVLAQKLEAHITQILNISISDRRKAFSEEQTKDL